MSDLLLAIVTAITNLLGPAAGPLPGGLPIVALLTLIAVGLAVLPTVAPSTRSIVRGRDEALPHAPPPRRPRRPSGTGCTPRSSASLPSSTSRSLPCTSSSPS